MTSTCISHWPKPAWPASTNRDAARFASHRRRRHRCLRPSAARTGSCCLGTRPKRVPASTRARARAGPDALRLWVPKSFRETRWRSSNHPARLLVALTSFLRAHAHSILQRKAGMSGFQHLYSTALTSTDNGGSSDAGSRPCKQRCSRMPNCVGESVMLHASTANVSRPRPAIAGGSTRAGRSREAKSSGRSRGAQRFFPPPDPWTMAR